LEKLRTTTTGSGSVERGWNAVTACEVSAAFPGLLAPEAFEVSQVLNGQ
jgi:hypothetical protein